MRNIIISTVLFLFTVMSFISCSEEGEDVNDINKQTILVYMPWSGNDTDNGLYPYFINNLDSIEKAINSTNGLSGSRVVVLLSTSSNTASLYEILWNKNSGITHSVINTYNGNINTREAIEHVINDTRNTAPALNYAMIIGGHGTGWINKSDWQAYPDNTKKISLFKNTRYFGSISNNDYAIDIDDLAAAIENCNVKMQYILFDNCYMANAETAYCLRNSTNFMVASSSEIMAVGMPYYSMWSSLCNATPSYSGMTSNFKSFYSDYAIPCGTLTAIDCRQMENLAAVMKKINSTYSLQKGLADSIQSTDGFKQHIFYDLGSYVTALNPGRELLREYNDVMSKTIRSNAATDSLYSNLYGKDVFIRIKNNSGITISDPSIHPAALRGMRKTAWWTATH